MVLEISLWLRWGQLELNVSGLLNALDIHLDVSDLVTEENAEAFETQYAIAWRSAEDGTEQLLESRLEKLPTVQLSPTGTADGVEPVVSETYVLTAAYAGDGAYRVMEIELR